MKLPRLIPALIFCTSASAPAALISQWNFNGTSTATVPGTTSAPLPSVGTGTASLIGGVTASFNSGAANGGSTDPVTTSPNNYGWGTSTYPATAVGDQTGGVQFTVSTVGYDTITISYDLRHSNSSSRYEAVQYSTDGTTFTTHTYFSGEAGDTWFNGRTVDLSGIAGAANNPNFAIRIVAAFETTATGAGVAGYRETASAYAPGGTWRFDMVTINGAAVPEPSAALLGVLSGFFLLKRRRS